MVLPAIVATRRGRTTGRRIGTAFLLFRRDRKGRRVQALQGERAQGLMSKILPGGLYFGTLFQLIFKLFVVPNLKIGHKR